LKKNIVLNHLVKRKIAWKNNFFGIDKINNNGLTNRNHLKLKSQFHNETTSLNRTSKNKTKQAGF
jgi:hypothetical protein